MGKSDVGPDMLDCTQLADSIQQMNECTITILLDVAGFAGGSTLRASALAIPKEVVFPSCEWHAAVSALWPDKQGRDFPSFLLNVLYELDKEIDEVMRREPEKA